MSESANNGPRPGSRRPWEQPTLKPMGSVGTIVAGGGGKISTSNADPGEPKKPSGQG